MSYITIKKWTVATVQVVYYIPDHLHIVNEFMWQTEDQIPEYPRITRFLDYWDKNIDGPIKETDMGIIDQLILMAIIGGILCFIWYNTR